MEKAQVVLVGAPGSGKSTVGGLLALHLGVPFFDVDSIIEGRAGRTIAEIFADDGEPAFRAVEESTTAELLALDGVLSLGGGAVMSPLTRAALIGHRVVWLRVGVPTAVNRVGLNVARPLLMGNVRGRLIKLLAARAPLYAEVATEVVETDESTPEEIVQQIVQRGAHRG